MTISTTTSRVSYPGTGGVGPFAFPFKILADTDLLLTRVDDSTGLETTLTKGTDYSVSGVGNTTGSVTLTTALASGETLVIRRAPVLTQPVSLPNGGDFFASTHEGEFDRIVTQLQSIDDRARRSIGASEQFNPALLNLLVKPEAGKYLGWVSASQIGNFSAPVSTGVTLPAEGRTVPDLTTYLFNNAVRNVKDFDDDVGNGVHDDSDAFDRAIAAIQAAGGGVLLVPRPAVSYKITRTIVIPAVRIAIVGEEPGLQMTIYYTPQANNAPLFQYHDGDNVRFANLDVNLANTGAFTGITAFDLGNPAVSAAWFERVFITGFNQYGILLDSAQYLKIDGCRFLGMRSPNATPAEGIRVNGFLNSGSIIRSRFDQNDKDIRIIIGNAVSLRDNSHERSGNTSDGLYPIVGATIDRIIEIEGVNGLIFENPYIEAPVPGGTNAFLYLNDCSGFKISAGSWGGEWGPPGTAVTTRMINIANTTGVGGGIIEAARFNQTINAFIRVDSTGSVIRINDCRFKDGLAEIATSDREGLMALMDGAAKNQLDFNNFDTEVAWDPASLADGAGETSGPVTITGAEFGDKIEATLGVDRQGVLLDAWVSAADTVKARLQNETGGVVDLAASTMRLRLRKRVS